MKLSALTALLAGCLFYFPVSGQGTGNRLPVIEKKQTAPLTFW
ncbi:MAG: hypothetical protein WKI04_10635 [Ferruginibacter sp.]